MIRVLQNLHTHTSFCDGKNTPQEMAQSALGLGMTSLGFSGHAYTPHDESYCMSLEKTQRYFETIEAMKRDERFSHLTLFVGLEQDLYSVPPAIDTQFLIGSVHYVEKCGEYIPVDETREHIESAVTRLYGGDVYAFLEDYYRLVSQVYDKTRCDIVGHIDLCEKFNGDGSLFDRNAPRYTAAYESAVKTLASSGCIFEVNTGAMSRGYTDFPYPQKRLLETIKKYGGRITLSSDSHSAETVNYKLDEMCAYAKSCGFDERFELNVSGAFTAVPI